jgi:hypothetical protein
MTSKIPEENGDEYLSAVLKLYLELPETPLRAGPNDRNTAIELHQRGVTLLTVEGALFLVSLRRLGRPPDYPPLSPIRSLAYFKPTIEELICNPMPEGYLDYLRRKVQLLGGQRQIKKCG